MPTTSTRRKVKTISKSLKPQSFLETGKKYILTHQNNTEVLEKFSNEMAKLSDLARTVKEVMEGDSSSTNSMGFDTTR